MDAPSGHYEDSKVPQECPETGMSHDYLNEFMHVMGRTFLRKNQGRPLVEILSECRPFKKYFERYSGHPRSDLINDRSRDRIPLLDLQVEIMNEEMKNPTPDEERFKKAWNEAWFLVQGDRSVQFGTIS